MSQTHLTFLERSPQSATDDTAPLLVLLHGRAAYAKTIFSIEGLLDPRYYVVAIQAPYPSEIGGFEWFHPLPETGGNEIEDAEHFDDVEQLLTDNLSFHIHRTHSETAPLFLWGFSQGAAMSHIVGLRGRIRTTGIVPMSGFLPRPIRQWHEWNTRLHVLLAHGTNDEVLSTASSKSARAFLDSIGVPVEYYEYKGRHKMTLESIAYINTWLMAHAALPPTDSPRFPGGNVG